MQITPEKYGNLIQRIVESVHPLKIILFGSHARGQATAESDIDLLVIVPDGTHRRKTSQCIYRHLLGFGISVDIVTATPADVEKYRESPGLIYQEALKDGKELYAA